MEEKICHREKIWIVQVPYAQAAYVSLSGWPFPYTIWPHSIFINNHANVRYFLTVSLTQCHISNSVWQLWKGIKAKIQFAIWRFLIQY